jgi:hypothetical protein
LGVGSADRAAPAFGVMMETGYPEGPVALVAILDGNASLYMGGGGVIGGIGHEQVRQPAGSFVRLANQYLKFMAPVTAFPRPRDGRTVFYVLTDWGVFSAEANEVEMGEQRHVLSPLFNAGHEVVSPHVELLHNRPSAVR